MKTDSKFDDPFDEVIAGKLAGIEVPSGLRERCLAMRKDVRAGGKWPVLPLAALLAAALLIAGLVTWSNRHGADSLRVASEDFATFFDSDFQLDVQSDDLERIREWYASGHEGRNLQIPAVFDEMTSIGCRTIDWGGEHGTLVCFRLKDGRLAHLIVIPDRAFSDPPGAERELARVGRWERTAWSTDGMTYLVFAPSEADVG